MIERLVSVAVDLKLVAKTKSLIIILVSVSLIRNAWHLNKNALLKSNGMKKLVNARPNVLTLTRVTYYPFGIKRLVTVSAGKSSNVTQDLFGIKRNASVTCLKNV